MSFTHLTLIGLFIGVSVAQAKAPKCTYKLDKNSVEIGWTAFKTTEKVAVDGSFKHVTVNGKLTAPNRAKLLKGLTVEVDKSSLETGKPERNVTVGKFFFDKLAGGKISGRVTDFNEDAKSMILVLQLNGQKKDVAMTVETAGDVMKAKGSFDVLDFGAKDAMGSLNQACLDLHKGKDGVSKTWSEVILNFQGKVTSICK